MPTISNPREINLQEVLSGKSGFYPTLECIEVPKVFDECRIKRCLVYGEGPDTLGTCSPGSTTVSGTDAELREILEGVRVEDISGLTPCRNFNMVINSVVKIPVQAPAGCPITEGFKRVIVNFTISFDVDVVLNTGQTRTLHYSVNRTETVQSLYCPESLSQIAVRRNSTKPISEDVDPEIIKLVALPQCLSMNYTDVSYYPKTADAVEGRGPRLAIDVTLAYDLIVKCELIVQLSVLSFGYCVPDVCPDAAAAATPCENFCGNYWPPKFYPDQLPYWCGPQGVQAAKENIETIEEPESK